MGKDRYLDLERRRFPRLEDNIFIFSKLRLSPIKLFKTITKNISLDGLMFETERNISKGSKVNMEIYQPINRGKTIIFCIPILTKIIWIRRIDKDNFEHGENKYKVGAKFLEIKEVDRKQIGKYVEKNISQK